MKFEFIKYSKLLASGPSLISLCLIVCIFNFVRDGTVKSYLFCFFARNFMCHRALIVCSDYELYIELENNFSCLYKFSKISQMQRLF